MEELGFQTKGFFRRVKEFERMEGIFIGVWIPVGIIMIICALMWGIFFFTLEVIELGPIFGINAYLYSEDLLFLKKKLESN